DADLVGRGKRELRPAYLFQMTDDEIAQVAPQLVAALAPDAEELHLLALVAQLAGLAPRGAHDGGIEPAAEPAVRSHDHDQLHAVAPVAGEQRGRPLPAGHAGGERAQHALHALGIRPRRLRRLL